MREIGREAGSGSGKMVPEPVAWEYSPMAAFTDRVFSNGGPFFPPFFSIKGVIISLDSRRGCNVAGHKPPSETIFPWA